MDWPSDSPDFNPNEKFWLIMKNKVCAANQSSLQNLQEQIREVWCLDMSPACFKKTLCQHAKTSPNAYKERRKYDLILRFNYLLRDNLKSLYLFKFPKH